MKADGFDVANERKDAGLSLAGLLARLMQFREILLECFHSSGPLPVLQGDASVPRAGKTPLPFLLTSPLFLQAFLLALCSFPRLPLDTKAIQSDLHSSNCKEIENYIFLLKDNYSSLSQKKENRKRSPWLRSFQSKKSISTSTHPLSIISVCSACPSVFSEKFGGRLKREKFHFLKMESRSKFLSL